MGQRSGRGRAALVVVLGASVVAACSSDHTETWTTTVAQPVSAVHLVNRDGDVKISVGDTLTISRRIDYRTATPEPLQTVSGTTLTIDTHCTGCGVTYTVTLPAATAVDVVDRSGNVEVDGLTGKVSVDDTAGNITGRHLRGASVDTHTAAGNTVVGLDAAPATLTARSDAGDVDVVLPRGATYDVHTHSSPGATTVTVPTSTRARSDVTATTGAGSVHVTSG